MAEQLDHMEVCHAACGRMRRACAAFSARRAVMRAAPFAAANARALAGTTQHLELHLSEGCVVTGTEASFNFRALRSAP